MTAAAQIWQPKGMAHFAGTYEVSGVTCGECRFYQKRCGKYRIMTGRKGEPFASTTPACKHFEGPVDHR